MTNLVNSDESESGMKDVAEYLEQAEVYLRYDPEEYPEFTEWVQNHPQTMKENNKFFAQVGAARTRFTDPAENAFMCGFLLMNCPK